VRRGLVDSGVEVEVDRSVQIPSATSIHCMPIGLEVAPQSQVFEP
jgi:hypothetical protein